MRLLSLYLRSRLTGWAVLSLAASGVVEWLWLRQFPPEDVALTMSLIVIPLVPAVLIGAGARSPFGDIERTASRAVGTLRGGHLVALFLLGSLVLILGASGVTTGIEPELIRNLAGYLGLTLLAVWLIGTGVAWIVPLGYAALALVIFPSSRLAWPARFPIDAWSLSLAVTSLALGLLAVTLHGARDRPEERA